MNYFEELDRINKRHKLAMKRINIEFWLQIIGVSVCAGFIHTLLDYLLK